MVLTKERKLLLGILGVLGLALVGDRLFVLGGDSGPQTASAQDGPAKAETKPSQTTAKSTTNQRNLFANQGQAFDAWLSKWSNAPQNDAWANLRWTETNGSPNQTNEGLASLDTTQTQALGFQAFAEQGFNVQGIVGQGLGRMVMINGRVFQAGDAVGPYRIKEVHEKQLVVEMQTNSNTNRG